MNASRRIRHAILSAMIASLGACKAPPEPPERTYPYSMNVQGVAEDFRLTAFSTTGDLVGTRGTGAETRGVRVREGVETELTACIPVAVNIRGDIACGGWRGAIVDRNGVRTEVTPDSLREAQVGGIDDEGRVFGTFSAMDYHIPDGYFHGLPWALQLEPAGLSGHPWPLQANASNAGLITAAASSGERTPYWFAEGARVVSVYGGVPIFLNDRNDILGASTSAAAVLWWGDAPPEREGFVFAKALALPGDCTPFAITNSRQLLGKSADGERCIVDATGQSRRVGAGLDPDAMPGWRIAWDGPTDRYHAAGYLAVDARHSAGKRGIAIIRVE